jgi:hypothetical protein
MTAAAWAIPQTSSTARSRLMPPILPSIGLYNHTSIE